MKLADDQRQFYSRRRPATVVVHFAIDLNLGLIVLPRPQSHRRPLLERLEWRNLLATLPDCLATDDCTLREYPDVNGDGNVSPIDVLLLVNYINKHGVGAPAPENPPPFVDLNEDGFVTPSDAMIVVNFLNGNPSQGESPSPRIAPVPVEDSWLSSGESRITVEPLSRDSLFRTPLESSILEEAESPIADLIQPKRRDDDCLACQDGLADDDGALFIDALTSHSVSDDINSFFGA